MCNFLDGGASDPFGIATALASGADEIFCVNAVPDLFSVRKVHFGQGILRPLHIFDNDKESIDEKVQTFDGEGGRTIKDMKLVTYKVKTVENIYFGIEEGREVILHVFSAQSTELSTGDIVAGAVDGFSSGGSGQ